MFRYLTSQVCNFNASEILKIKIEILAKYFNHEIKREIFSELT